MSNIGWHWSAEPMHAKLFLLCLVGICVAASVLGVRLVRCLKSFTFHKKLPIESVLKGGVDSHSLPRLVLSNRVSITPWSDREADSNRTRLSLIGTTGFAALRDADSEFYYLFGSRHAEVVLTRRLAVLTVILSFFTATYGGFSTWASRFSESNVTGYEAFLVAIQILLSRLALGLGVSAVLWAASSFFELLLEDRLVKWKYLFSRVVAYNSAPPTEKQIH
jgi:hypothetical protein